MKSEFTGMLPGAIQKFEELFTALEAAGLHPRITGGYAGHGGDEDLRTWGVVCDMQCDDPDALATAATDLGIAVAQDGSLSYTAGLTIDDFQTLRVGPDLTLQPENAEEV